MMLNIKKRCHIIIFFFFMFLIAPVLIAGEMEEGVQVFVSKQYNKHNVRYSYTVNNHSGLRITQVRIGSDYLHGDSELISVPFKYKPGKKISSSSIRTPKLWLVSLISAEEDPNFELRWNIKSGKFGIPDNSSLSGFQVLVASEDTSYETSHWTVILENGSAKFGTLLLQ